MRRTACLLAMLLVLSGCTSEKTGEAALPAEEAVVSEAFPELPEEPAPVPEPVPEPPSDPSEFVRVADFIPDIAVDLRYAGTDNFTGQAVYDFSDAYLRYGTVEKLASVQAGLAAEGLGLKIWDAYRPAEAQFRLWQICPDSRYVANPNKGFSSHSRGNTIDLTLADENGGELTMPTGFDDFTAKADRDYSDVSPEAAENARRLEKAMTAAGFKPYAGEWWHYSDEETYEVEEAFQPPENETGGDIHG